MNGWHMNGWFMGGMWLFWFVVVLLVALAAVALLRSTQQNQRSDGSAKEVLKERYARGEISKQDYDRMLSDIGR